MNPVVKEVASTVATAEPIVVAVFYIFITGVVILAGIKVFDLLAGKIWRKMKIKQMRRVSKDILECVW